MDRRLLTAFSDELEKISEKWHDTAELAGLGILAAPHAYNLVTGKKASHKTERNTELVGLGTLMSPYVHKMMSKKAGKRKLAMNIIGKAVVPAFLKGRPAAAVPALARGTATMATPATPAGVGWRGNTGAIPLTTPKRHGGAVQAGTAHGVPATPAPPAQRKWGQKPTSWRDNPNAIEI